MDSTERPTTISCGLISTMKGCFAKVSKNNENCDQSNVYVLVKEFVVKFMNYFRDDYFSLKRQGARVKICK
jgi:hypothetical protein